MGDLLVCITTDLEKLKSRKLIIFDNDKDNNVINN